MLTYISWGHLSALVFSPLTTRATFTKCKSCTLPFGQLRLHFTTRANSMKRADGKRVCRRSRESYAWSGRRTAAAHRWSLRSGSIDWRSSFATHSPSTASGNSTALQRSTLYILYTLPQLIHGLTTLSWRDWLSPRRATMSRGSPCCATNTRLSVSERCPQDRTGYLDGVQRRDFRRCRLPYWLAQAKT